MNSESSKIYVVFYIILDILEILTIDLRGIIMIYYKDDEILIRSVNKLDATVLFKWRISKELNKYDPRPVPTESHDLYKECELFCNTFDNYIVNELNELNKYKYFMIENMYGEQIGFVNLFGFNEERTQAELGVIIGDKSYWNKGVGYKSVKAVLDCAFNELHLSRVYIETGESNEPALKLCDKLGFNKCGEYTEDFGFKFIVMEKIKKNN